MPFVETTTDIDSIAASSTTGDMEACVEAAFAEETQPFEDQDDDEFADIELEDDEERGTVKRKGNEQQQHPQPLRTPLSPSSIAGVVNEVLAMYRRSHQREEADSSTTDACTIDEESSSSPSSSFSDEESSCFSNESFSELCQEIREFRTGLDASTSPEIAMRVENYHKARFLRSHHKSHRPWGLLAVFFHLVDMRHDLEWAQDAAYRRAHNLPYLSWADFEDMHRRKTQHVIHRTPWFVYAIVLASTATLLYSFARMNWKVEDLKVNPMLGPSPEVLLDMGALFTPRIVADNEWYRLFAPMILHVGILHFLLNMVALLVVGAAIERIHGSWMTGVVFCAASVGGSLAGAVFSPNTMSVGASGGIFSMFGLCLADIWSNWDLLTLKDDHGDGGVPVIGVLSFICLDICLNLSIGLTPWIDNFAHVGGFVYGTCLSIIFAERLGQSGFFGKVTRRRRVSTACCKCLAFLVVTVLMVSTFGVLYSSDPVRGPQNVCPGCQHITCVPFPFWKEDKWWDCGKCMAVRGSIRQKNNGTAILELSCPEGGKLVNIDLKATNPDKDAVRAQLPGYCRKLC